MSGTVLGAGAPRRGLLHPGAGKTHVCWVAPVFRFDVVELIFFSFVTPEV